MSILSKKSSAFCSVECRQLQRRIEHQPGAGGSADEGDNYAKKKCFSENGSNRIC